MMITVQKFFENDLNPFLFWSDFSILVNSKLKIILSIGICFPRYGGIHFLRTQNTHFIWHIKISMEILFFGF